MTIKYFTIFTNGNCMAFDYKGQQIREYQGNIHKIDMGFVIENTEVFEIAKFREWKHELTKSEVNFLFCQL